MKKLQRFYKSISLGLATLAVVISGGIAYANQNGQEASRHEPTPVWEEVDREIKLNPNNPAPPEIVNNLVSLKVTYKDFDRQTRHGIVEVDQRLKDEVITFFRYAYYLNFPFKEIVVSSDSRFGWDDVKLMEANVTSCFNYRTVAGSTTLSTHALGQACDINPRQNPYITLDEQGNPFVQPKGAYWNVGTPGTLHNDHPLIQLVKSRSWIWGGDWTLQDEDGAVIDYQHVQKRLPAPTASSAAIQNIPDKAH